MSTKNKNKELSFSSLDDLVNHYDAEEGILVNEDLDVYEDFINETQGVVSQFHDFIKERFKDELSRPICPQCNERVDELHKINGDEDLAYCESGYDCREQAFEQAEKRFKW